MLDLRATKCVMLGYPEGVKGYMLWVLGVQSIKIINSRNVVFNESEMPCLENKSDNSKEQMKENTSQFEVKLARLSHIQPENVETDVEQSDENIVNTNGGEVDVLQAKVETEIENNDIPTNETSIQNYQLVRDREMRQVRPNPRYEINNLTDFALISGESL